MTRGRPRLPAHKKRMWRLSPISVTTQELEALHVAAARLQVPLAAFVRSAALFAASNLSAEALGLGRKEAP